MISLLTRSPISILKEIFTNSCAKKSSILLPSSVSFKSTKSADGGLISIILSNIEDREVAALPIIWFIASLMALKCSSPSSTSVFVPSPPIIRSVIIFTSFSRRTKRLLPSSPTVYAIRMKTHGLSYASTISSHVANVTTGVDMSTFLFTRENKVVAAVPMLILETSPIMSISSGVSFSALPSMPLSAPPFSRALISSCDKTPSIASLLLSDH